MADFSKEIGLSQKLKRRRVSIFTLCLCFVRRSIRSGNFPPYTQSLTKLVHWFFTYGHYHYIRCVSPQFTSLIWWLCLTCTPHVSRIPGGTLHGQEDESWQHNAVVKDDGVARGLTECSAALKRWMFSRPDMACVIIDFERWVDHALYRSAEDIHVRCDVSKICYWGILQSISRNQ